MRYLFPQIFLTLIEDFPMPTDQHPAPSDLAVLRFQQGFACSQAVFSSLACQEALAPSGLAPSGSDPGTQLPEETALRIAAPFGGGISHTGQICGAVSGALMALGLFRGSDRPDQAAKERTYALARQLIARFTESHGSVLCSDLLGADMSTPEGLARVREEKLTQKTCPCLVRDAVESTLAVLNLPAPDESIPG